MRLRIREEYSTGSRGGSDIWRSNAEDTLCASPKVRAKLKPGFWGADFKIAGNRLCCGMAEMREISLAPFPRTFYFALSLIFMRAIFHSCDCCIWKKRQCVKKETQDRRYADLFRIFIRQRNNIGTHVRTPRHPNNLHVLTDNTFAVNCINVYVKYFASYIIEKYFNSC